MGVRGLWSLLGSSGTSVNLADCSGVTLAVDLSAWILQCSLPPSGRNLSRRYFGLRNVFYRAKRLLSMGLKLVFVSDSQKPPELKSSPNKRIRGETYNQVVREYIQMLQALGLTVLESPGEAEKLCAALNEAGVVDGCLTNDGDVFLYGARNVYRNWTTEGKDTLVTLVSLTEEQNISRRDLVTFALLSGCDMCPGVPGIGQRKFVELLQEFKSNGVTDSLERVKSWASSPELKDLADLQCSLLSLKKGKHCSTCCHEGTKVDHSREGCRMCQTTKGCTDKAKPCVCAYCPLVTKTSPFKTELTIRKKALESDSAFPDTRVIDEFLSGVDDVDQKTFTPKLPDWDELFYLLYKMLSWDHVKVLDEVAPLLINMWLHGTLDEIVPVPECIEAQCKENFRECYRVQWRKLELDKWTEADEEQRYTFTVTKKLFTTKFPEMAEKFDSELQEHKKTKSGKKKRHLPDDSNQNKLTDVLKVKKKLFAREELSPPVKMSIDPSSSMTEYADSTSTVTEHLDSAPSTMECTDSAPSLTECIASASSTTE